MSKSKIDEVVKFERQLRADDDDSFYTIDLSLYDSYVEDIINEGLFEELSKKRRDVGLI